jgi:hypothetical protein
MNYLEYLEYFRDREYAKFITYVPAFKPNFGVNVDPQIPDLSAYIDAVEATRIP